MLNVCNLSTEPHFKSFELLFKEKITKICQREKTFVPLRSCLWGYLSSANKCWIQGIVFVSVCEACIDMYIINVLIVKHPHINYTQLWVSLSFLCLSWGSEVLTRCQGTEVLTVTYPAVYIWTLSLTSIDRHTPHSLQIALCAFH